MSLLSRAGPCARCHAEPCPPGADDRIEESISLAHLLLYTLVHGNSHMPGMFIAQRVDTRGVSRQWSPHVRYVSTPSHINTPVYTTTLSHMPSLHTHPLHTHACVHIPLTCLSLLFSHTRSHAPPCSHPSSISARTLRHRHTLSCH